MSTGNQFESKTNLWLLDLWTCEKFKYWNRVYFETEMSEIVLTFHQLMPIRLIFYRFLVSTPLNTPLHAPSIPPLPLSTEREFYKLLASFNSIKSLGNFRFHFGSFHMTLNRMFVWIFNHSSHFYRVSTCLLALYNVRLPRVDRSTNEWKVNKPNQKKWKKKIVSELIELGNFERKKKKNSQRK